MQVIHAALLLVEILSFENALEKYNRDFTVPSIKAAIPLISAIRLLYDVHMSIYTKPLVSRSKVNLKQEISGDPSLVSLSDALPPFSALKEQWYLNSKKDILLPEYMFSIANVDQLNGFVQAISSTASVLQPLQVANEINIPPLPFENSAEATIGEKFPTFNVPSIGEFPEHPNALLTLSQKNFNDTQNDQNISISWQKTVDYSSWRHGRHYPLIPGLYKRGDSETYGADTIFQSCDFDALLQAASAAIGFSKSELMYHLSIFDRTYLRQISKSNIFRRFLV